MREPVERPLILCEKAGSAHAADSAVNRRARCDSRKRVSVDEPAEEVPIVDELTRGIRGRRGAFRNLPEVQVNENSFDDCRIFQEADDGRSTSCGRGSNLQ